MGIGIIFTDTVFFSPTDTRKIPILTDTDNTGIGIIFTNTVFFSPTDTDTPKKSIFTVTDPLSLGVSLIGVLQVHKSRHDTESRFSALHSHKSLSRNRSLYLNAMTVSIL